MSPQLTLPATPFRYAAVPLPGHFNVANALGAWLGGLVIAAGHGYRSPALVGVGLSGLGLLILLWSAVVHRRTPAAMAPVAVD